jgi:hypothetical protein
MHIAGPFGCHAYLVSSPYPQRLIATTVSGLSRACHRWLVATGKFVTGSERPEIGGVAGKFSEHLCRMISASRPIDLGIYDVWNLLLERDNARNWSDDETVAALDECILPSVYVETFEPDTLLRLTVAAPAAEWWLEPQGGTAQPTVRTVGPVRYAICKKVAAHLGVLPENVIPQITDPRGRPFGNEPDQPTSGFYAVRLRFGGATRGVRLP